MKLNKKGQSVFDNFGSMAIGVGALCITLVVAFLIMAQAKTTMTDDDSACADGTWNGSVCCLSGMADCLGVNQSERNSLAWNATGSLQSATEGIPGWVSIVIITAIGAALIGMVAMFRR